MTRDLQSSTPSYWGLPIGDLTDAVARCESDLVKWAGARVLVTGATGVLGAWLVSTLLHGSDALDLDLDLALVTRHATNLPDAVTARRDVEVIEIDVRSLRPSGAFDLVIHGAAGASSIFGSGDAEPREMATTIVDGTRRVLESAASSDTRLLFLSSGAVYGSQYAPVDECARGGPNPLDPRSAYGESKRLAELLCATATQAGEVDAVIARLFAFIGPRVPLDSYYAAGNFLGDLRRGEEIQVAGNGRPRRTYLYCGDLAEWCLAIATRGVSGDAYNVGSPEYCTIAELAGEIAQLRRPRAGVVVHQPPGEGPDPWYVPVTDKARDELGLAPRVGRREGLTRWWQWLS